MTLDCPFCNPLQSRVTSVRSCYLTSILATSLSIESPQSTYSSRTLESISSQPSLLSAFCGSSSYVRHFVLECSVRVFCVLRVTCVKWSKSVRTRRFLLSFREPEFLPVTVVRSRSCSLCALSLIASVEIHFFGAVTYILIFPFSDLASRHQVPGLFLVHGTHPFWL